MTPGLPMSAKWRASAMRAPPVVLLDSASPDLDAMLAQREQDAGTGRGERLRCRACGAGITDEGQRRPVDGSHAHTRTNPAGMRFTFGCFREAPGCRCLGAATAEHTWFAGCVWRVAACAGCGEHLGWSFTGADTFFGLILMRLVGDRNS
jgi:hypothetical protein